MVFCFVLGRWVPPPGGGERTGVQPIWRDANVRMLRQSQQGEPEGNLLAEKEECLICNGAGGTYNMSRQKARKDGGPWIFSISDQI